MPGVRNYDAEIKSRVAFLRQALAESGATGFVFGNSGGKDSTLVGILLKMACDDTVGVMLPCHARRNFESDREDAEAVAAQYGIALRRIDLTKTRDTLLEAVREAASPTDMAIANIAPRLRMTALYAVAGAENRLVAGTGNRSEMYMGYFTKWGDGAYDINPIADLAATEVYAFLRHLDAPESILAKAPSAGLYEGQTDEAEMGVTYRAIDHYLKTGEASPQDLAIIERYHRRSEHKRRPPIFYTNDVIL